MIGAWMGVLLAGALMTATPEPGRTPVLVELFSSEGCSSCPPADALLRDFSKTQPISGVEIVPLELHVDYWNRLGWTDPFSSAELSARQSAYAAAWKREDIYTPQMVVDGTVAFVGSDEGRAREAIASAARTPKRPVHVEIKGDVLAVSVDAAPAASPGELWLAVTESDLSTQVTSGENAGHTLAHAPIARVLRQVAHVDAAALHLDVPLTLPAGVNRAHARAVVFIQEPRSRRIVGVATAAL